MAIFLTDGILEAAGGAEFFGRDRVLGILWAERAPERARHSLAQALYSLRKELGTEVVVATDLLQLDAERITSDVEELHGALACKEWERAAALYRGPFLDGFHLLDHRIGAIE